MITDDVIVYKSSDNDPLESLVGKLVKVYLRGKGPNFAARFIALKGPELWFESKRGLRWMANRETIKTIAEIAPMGA